MGVDVDSGALCLTPTKLKVVPSIRIENASYMYLSLPGLPLRGDGEEDFASFVSDIDTLTLFLTFKEKFDRIWISRMICIKLDTKIIVFQN